MVGNAPAAITLVVVLSVGIKSVSIAILDPGNRQLFVALPATFKKGVFFSPYTIGKRNNG